MDANRRLNLARALVILGLLVGLVSWYESVNHIGDDSFLVPAYPLGPTHSWYHVFREAGGDVAKMTVFLLLLFGPAQWRTPITWWVGLILMLGYYLPFWVGAPFLAALSAPNALAEAIHLGMAVPALAGWVVARPVFDERARAKA